MNSSVERHPLVLAYLDALRREAAPLPRSRREELAGEIQSHIEVVLPPEPTEAEVRNVLERLGTPEEIVDAELDGEPPRSRREPLTRGDVVGLLLVLLGGFAVPPIGYLVGTALLGASRRWSAPVRVLLVGLPCVAVLVLVAQLVRNGQWYVFTDLLTSPRLAFGEYGAMGVVALPYTAAQTAALVVARHLSPLAKRR
ncbi:hypothetical protein ABZ816_41785 [Actinosynnema sp. NPDC047251]|uniref:Uncharacterized protein n=1 Tax=Saccharothrix espanaensis (strain ATCC 51144 / DSM 44229 / JCM 9112 / NBRC 15066 / NRRL 15764) TaxID=1179773 RepID=K0JPW1_SACES|nr:hypothetical protein [Saccharothrix espanaensis]CCH27501.1 hypothetical protein BN6_01680 [Saccharothrix espanaensis DSM 44229]